MNWKQMLCAMLLSGIVLPIAGRHRRAEVTFYTTQGNIIVVLYNETPRHRNNFLHQVQSGTYDGVLFHRVIKDFMVQGGDPLSRTAQPGAALGDGDERSSDWLEPEFRLPHIYHHRGVLAAAREGDEVNPQQKSSSQQFYIVTGRTFDDAQLDKMLQRMEQASGSKPLLTPEMREDYRTRGGAPHLDGAYTVFGEVKKGMEVVKKIEAAATDANDRPLEDIRILRAKVTKRAPRRQALHRMPHE